MSIAPRQLTGLILHQYQPSQSANIVTLYQGGDNPITTNARTQDTFRGAACFLKNLRLKASVPSLPAKTPAQFELEDDDSARVLKALDLEWTGDRYELNLWAAKQAESWIKIGGVSLININSYPYRTYNLMDFITDSIAQEIGLDEKIGYSLTDVGKGLPTAADEISISGSWLEEIYTESPVQIVGGSGGSDVDLDPILARITALEAQVANPPSADWRLGDYIYSAALPSTGFLERWGKLWVAMGSKIAKPGTPSEQNLFADERLFSLYELFWQSSHVALSVGKGTSASNDWNAQKWLQLPTLDNRVLGIGDAQKFNKLEGDETRALTVDQIPIHSHEQTTRFTSELTHKHSHSAYSGAAEAPEPSYDWGTKGGRTKDTGGGQAFSIVQPTAFIGRALLICAGNL